MSIAFVYVGLISALLFLQGCCSIPDPTFDAREGTADSRSLVFTHFDLNKKLPEDALRPPMEPHVLGPGDVVDIEIMGYPSSRAETFIMPDGLLYFDLTPSLKAEGLTVSQLQVALQDQLATHYINPRVNVTLTEVKSARYWILGRIYQPGVYPLKQPVTLLEAVSSAGGLFTYNTMNSTQEMADLSSSIVMRKGEILPVDFEALINKGDMSQNIYLKDGDYIYIPSGLSQGVLLLGAVRMPRLVGYSSDLDIVSCLAQGGGPMPGAFLNRVVIVRGSLKEPQVAIVDASAILTGKEPSIRLQPGDVVWVPTAPWSTISKYLNMIIGAAVSTVAVNEGNRFGDYRSAEPLSVSIPLTP